MKNRQTNFKETYRLAHFSTQNALRPLAQRSGYIDELMNQMYFDMLTLDPQNQEYRAKAQAKALENLEQLASDHKTAYRRTKRLTLSDQEKTTALHDLERIKYEEQDTRGYIDDLESLDNRTVSERQDCVHEWAEYYLFKTPTQKVIDNTVAKLLENYESFEMLQCFTLQEILEQATRRYAQNHVCNYANNQGGLNALDRMKVETIYPTTAEVKAWLESRALWERYPLKATTTRALEIDKNGDYVFKDRSYTYRKNVCIMTTDEDGNEVMKHANSTIIQNRQDLEQLQALENALELTYRERQFIRLFQTRECQEYGAKARALFYCASGNLNMRNYEFLEFLAQADQEQYKARLEFCYNKLGILNPSTQRTFLERLRRRIKTIKHIKSRYTFVKPGERQEPNQEPSKYPNRQELIYMMECNQGTKEPRTTKALDLISWTTRTQAHKHKNVVAWTDRTRTLERQELKEQRWSIAEPTEEQIIVNALEYSKQHHHDKQMNVDHIEPLTAQERAKAQARRQERAELLELMNAWNRPRPKAKAEQQPGEKKAKAEKPGKDILKTWSRQKAIVKALEEEEKQKQEFIKNMKAQKGSNEDEKDI